METLTAPANIVFCLFVLGILNLITLVSGGVRNCISVLVIHLVRIASSLVFDYKLGDVI